jgi:hypothetical protein|tara:strand:+ start:6610 stop:6897 length:288 start_codon:yes stop_codon:yes gene_type:complete
MKKSSEDKIKEAELVALTFLKVADQNNFESYKEWVLSLDKDELKGVILGCASFRLKYSNARIFAIDKANKIDAKFKVKIATSYLNFVKEIFFAWN